MDSLTIVEKFNEAFNNHDVNEVMSFMTDDCVFESTRPAPDGEKITGSENVRKFWDEFFKNSPKAHFETEDIFSAGDRCVVRWIYRWEKENSKGHVRGVDVFKVRDGKVCEKLSYVKG